MNPDKQQLDNIKSERTLVLLKPDAVARHIVGEIISRCERKGMKIVAMKMVWPSKNLSGQHYVDDEAWSKDNEGKTVDK